MIPLYYMDLFLPFGLCSSPALFNEYADALHYTMQINKVQDLLHYLGDYFTVGPPDFLVCASNIATMMATYEELGFTVNPQKVIKPATSTNFFGVDIDSVSMEPGLTPVISQKLISLLQDILGHQSATKWTILIIGRQTSFCVPGMQAF